jgi:hypothetical protein
MKDKTENKQAEDKIQQTEALQNYREHLEEFSKERTTNLEIKNEQLMTEIAQRKEAEGAREKLILELQNALLKIRMLSGLLPVCSSCKKIRDATGYWEQIEVYIKDHSEAVSAIAYARNVLKSCIGVESKINEPKATMGTVHVSG